MSRQNRTGSTPDPYLEEKGEPKEVHEKWALLGRRSPLAASLMHLLCSRVGDHNAVVVSQPVLAQILCASERGVRDALNLLVRFSWIEKRQIGRSSTTNAYVINSRVAWTKTRENLRYSLFSATVLVSADEQPDKNEFGCQEPLNTLPLDLGL